MTWLILCLGLKGLQEVNQFTPSNFMFSLHDQNATVKNSQKHYHSVTSKSKEKPKKIPRKSDQEGI